MKKVLSFSLFGDNDLYCLGAIENAKLCDKIYNGWETRFYVSDDVPYNIINELNNYNVEVIICKRDGHYDGLFWRFKPFYEDDTSIWVSRDCDSRISTRERCCVDEWVESGKPAHLIRDAHNHVYEIMAGMFGINNVEYRKKYPTPELLPNNSNNRENDQTILKDKLWPIIMNDHLCHDYWEFNKPDGQPKYLLGDPVHFDKAYGCGLINYVLNERRKRHTNLYGADVRKFPEHGDMEYGVFIGQIIDENNNPVFDMVTHWEYEIRGLKMK